MRARISLFLLASGIAVAVLGPASAQSLGDLVGQARGVASPKSNVSSGEASTGMKAALDRAAEAVVGQLGAPGGFANDPKVRIGLPGPLGKLNGVMGMLDKVGVTDNLSGKLNGAAEGAVAKALPLLKRTISRMTVQDAMGIVTGGPTSATDYFRRTMGGDLNGEMKPVVAKSLKGVDAFNALNKFTASNKLMASRFGPDDMTNYVTQKAGDGVFYYLGEQEKKIRANPLGTGSAIIAKVFGGG